MWESIPILLTGLKLTIITTVFGLVVGFVLGAFFGLMKTSRNMWLRKLAGISIESDPGSLSDYPLFLHIFVKLEKIILR